MHRSPENDRIIGAAHRGDEVGMGRGERGAPRAIEDARERKAELMRLVQRHFEHPRHHLHRAREALGGGEDDAEIARRQARRLRHFLDDGRGRRGGGFEHQYPVLGDIAVAELGKERLARRERPHRPRAEGEEFLVLEAPARILAAERGEHRLRGGDPQPEREPALVHEERDRAKAGEAELGDAPPRLDPPHMGRPRVDQPLAERAAARAEAELGGVGLEPLEELPGETIEADRRNDGGHGASPRRMGREV